MQSPSSRVRRARPLLGTIVEISAAGAEDGLQAALDAAFAQIELVQRLMSFHAADSDVARINAAAAGSEICIDPHTFKVLAFAQQLGDLSGGAFDIATAATLVRHGFLPAQAEPIPAAGATYRDLELLQDGHVRWRRRGWIDLGGIAKGYAVDCAVAALQAHGVYGGVVNAGGDLRCFGAAQAVQVRLPHDPAARLELGWLADHALATSAGYFASVEYQGERIEPLVDPAQSACVRWEESISVIAADCMTADALTKVVRLAPQLLEDILAHYNAQAIAINQYSTRACGSMLLQQEAVN